MKANNSFLASLKIAFFGLIAAFKEERNFRLQCFAAVVAIVLTIFLGLNAVEASIIFLMVLLVLGMELMNSQIEKFLDVLHPDHHPRVKIIKDFSAGAVLLSALGSLVVGVLIFLPHIIKN